MPHSRFNKLPAEKRENFLEIAAKEFATEGFEAASLNHILEQSGISKGSAYYYFEDKADVFLTVVQRYFAELTLPLKEASFDNLSAENFWNYLRDEYHRPLLATYDRPWMLGTIKAASKLSKKSRVNEELNALFNYIIEWTVTIFRRGQELGVVRTDLPDELMISLIQSIDDINDKWLLAHVTELQPMDISTIADRTVDLFYRLLRP
jgi:AcrR family transcriptional regulator